MLALGLSLVLRYWPLLLTALVVSITVGSLVRDYYALRQTATVAQAEAAAAQTALIAKTQEAERLKATLVTAENYRKRAVAAAQDADRRLARLSAQHVALRRSITASGCEAALNAIRSRQ